MRGVVPFPSFRPRLSPQPFGGGVTVYRYPMRIMERATWEEPGFTVAGQNPPAANLAAIDTTVIHWTGIENPSDGTDNAVASLLRSIQRDYVTNRGYAIGYQWCVDPRGTAWECRGFDYKSAANRDHNEHTATILVTTGYGEPVTEAAWATIRELSRTYAARNTAYRARPVPHSALSGASTACPGDVVRSQIDAGLGDIGNDDDMGTVVLWQHPAYLNVFAVHGGAVWINETVRDVFLARGAEYIVEDDLNMLRGCMAAAGIVDSDLVRAS